jgi:hypothetical protein
MATHRVSLASIAIVVCPTMPLWPQLLFLHAELSGNAEHKAHTESMERILQGRGLLELATKVDGSDPANRELRNA